MTCTGKREYPMQQMCDKIPHIAYNAPQSLAATFQIHPQVSKVVHSFKAHYILHRQHKFLISFLYLTFPTVAMAKQNKSVAK
jgi:hypothetical protein